ncbi:NAD(P)-dependent oxidoreductase [Glaciecola sp. MH2013]|uniref:NAD(P)-dependent oxidoreductase n=1 Tax=Glaciecola sp. MH2013 TaxID=2785524 RepID=UPI0018A0C6BA|nr:NAD(P)-dependent oxidoreductase [Glaciecola sp. MH2013]MBF7072814.1 NAD(P)-dependent oxidoreductase [Glaciecola sp. MH2013]
MKDRVAFIGLGAMGFPMALHLNKAGFDVSVYNRTHATALSWAEKSGKSRIFESPKAAAKVANVVLLCVGNDDDVRSVVYGEDGVLSGMSAGDVLIDHTTTSAELARELYKVCSDLGVAVLDAPVSGGQAGAEQGLLTVMVGGDSDVYARSTPIFDAYSQKHKLMGAIGSGQLTKMVNQICIAGVIQGLAEGLQFAKNAGLDTESVIDVISKGAASSWQMVNRSETMSTNQFDFGFAVDWMRKDLCIVLDEANKNNSVLPVTALVDQFYAQVQNNGGGRWDTSSLITLLNK